MEATLEKFTNFLVDAYNYTKGIPNETLIPLLIFAVVIVLAAEIAKKLAGVVAIIVAIVLVLNTLAPITTATSADIGPQLQSYENKISELLPPLTSKLPMTPSLDLGLSEKESSPHQAELDYELLSEILDKNWTPAFKVFSSKEFTNGEYQSINKNYTMEFNIDDIEFSADIWTDIPGLQVDSKTLATFIVGMACKNATTSSNPMPKHPTIVVSGGNCILDSESIEPDDDPATLLKTAFGHVNETTANGLCTHYTNSDSSLILICIGTALSSWDTSFSVETYDYLEIEAKGKEHATLILIHELCHNAFPGSTEESISISSAAIATDLGRNIFAIAP